LLMFTLVEILTSTLIFFIIFKLIVMIFF
jgi:hypothetical protein